MRFCQCPFPLPYADVTRCGRCFCRIEPEPNYCPDCEGEGFRTAPPVDITDDDYRWECETCSGTGEVARA